MPGILGAEFFRGDIAFQRGRKPKAAKLDALMLSCIKAVSRSTPRRAFPTSAIDNNRRDFSTRRRPAATKGCDCTPNEVYFSRLEFIVVVSLSDHSY